MNVDGFLQDVVFEWLSESPVDDVEGCIIRQLDTSPPKQKGAPKAPFQMSLAGLAFIMPPMLAARIVSAIALSPRRPKRCIAANVSFIGCRLAIKFAVGFSQTVP
jgi:hypothetical protein